MSTPLEKLQPPARYPAMGYVDACRKVLLSWLKSKANGDIWSRIARALPQTVVGDKLRSVDQLIDHVYFTDCLKCESKKEDSKCHRVHTPHLRDEFQILKNPVLFITLGREAWQKTRELQDGFFVGKLSRVEWPYQNLGAEPQDESVKDEAGKFVIPLTFPAGRPNALRNSYLVYLKEGLAALEKQREGPK